MTIEKTKSDIAEWLGEIAPDETVARLLGFSVGRLLLREGLHWRHKAESHRLDVMHVSDWLRTAVAGNAQWLARVDEHGRPKKLMKFGTFREMAAEADKSMRIAIQKAGSVVVDPDHERLHTTLSDGYAMVEMLSVQALDRESSLMQHCIGNGGYDGDVQGDGFLLLSLRDPFGKPHATLRIDRGKAAVVEFQGKQNQPPTERYMVYVREFLRGSGLTFKHGGETRLGMVQDVLGEWHRLDSLPDDLETMGSLRLRGAPVIRMPSRLVVNGDFEAPAWLDRLPDILHVSGEFMARSFPALTGGFKAGRMTLEDGRNHTGLLPERLDVGNLTVISAHGTRIIPKRFEVTGSLSLKLNDWRQVSGDMKVGGTLGISMCTMRKWPGNIDCGGLDVNVDAPLVFEGKLRVRGDLSVGNADVRFPSELRVSGNADFTDHGAGRDIAELPSRMFVAGDLDLGRCNIGCMPRHLEVGGDLVLTDAKFENLEGVKRVSGGLRIDGTEARRIPVGLTKVGGLWAAMSKLESLPEGFTTKSNLVVIGTPMTEFPSGMRIGGHLFGNDDIETLPGDAVVLGKVHGVRVPEHMVAVRQAGISRARSLHRR
ncbi:hypothetical protein HFN89_03560 [Rhizobium laguerreae]|nr:hypothetical protein [Rhizobium laguerreae]